MTLDDLVAIEEIKKLKARYFRLMDAKDWTTWADLFAEDCYLRWGPQEGDEVTGRDGIVREVSSRVGATAGVTVHHGHMPEITVTGPGSATGTWALFDYLDVRPDEGTTTDGFRKGYGRYDEEYERCADGVWRFKSIRLSFTRTDSYAPTR